MADRVAISFTFSESTMIASFGKNKQRLDEHTHSRENPVSN